MPVYIDKEKVRQTVAAVLDNIKTEADPWLLAEYHRLFKKEISVFNRGKAAAYLLMLCDQGKTLGRAKHKRDKQGRLPAQGRIENQGDSARKKNAPRKAENDRRFPSAADDDDDTLRNLLADEESKWLFFSIGRSRRVYPRDIIGLITTQAVVSREDIGSIRALENYSFVQVRDTAAGKIIEALHETKFRGRLLTVNYAKPRKSDDDLEQEHDHPEEEDI